MNFVIVPTSLFVYNESQQSVTRVLGSGTSYPSQKKFATSMGALQAQQQQQREKRNSGGLLPRLRRGSAEDEFPPPLSKERRNSGIVSPSKKNGMNSIDVVLQQQISARTHCYCLPGRLCADTLVLFRDSPLGDTHFMMLNESETALLEADHQFLASSIRRRVRPFEVDRLSQYIGIVSTTGGFTRNTALWQVMTPRDGTFTIKRCHVLQFTIKDENEPQELVLTDTEFEELSKINGIRMVSTSTQQYEREDFFLRSALRLLNDRSQKEINETDVYRRMFYRDFPATNEIVAFGLLKKRNKSLGWKERFVAVSCGRMFYVEKVSSSSSGSSSSSISLSTSVPSVTPTHLNNSGSSEKTSSTTKVIPLLLGRTWCQPLASSDTLWSQATNKYDPDRLFEVVIRDGPKYTWACESREERDRWVRLIQASCFLARSPEQIQDQNEVCTSIRLRNAQVGDNDVDGQIRMLKDLESMGEVKISVDWIQAQKNRARGEIDATMEQAIKDTVRDSVIINAHSVYPCNATSVLGSLCRQISIAVPEETEDAVLNFSRLILLATNRTQSGGLAFEACNLIINNPSGTVLVPANPEKNTPIEILVEKYHPTQSEVTPPPAEVEANSAAQPVGGLTSASTNTSNDKSPNPEKGSSGTSGGLKRRFHRRTASDSTTFLKILGLPTGNTSSTNLALMATGGNSNLPAAPPTPQEGATSSTPRPPVTIPTSPRNSTSNSLIRGLSIRGRKAVVESSGGSDFSTFTGYDENIRVKVDVKAHMVFHLLDEQFIGYGSTPRGDDEDDGKGSIASYTDLITGNERSRLAIIQTTYSRTFYLIEGRSFAVDQGLITLSVGYVNKPPPPSPRPAFVLAENTISSKEAMEISLNNTTATDATLILHPVDESDEEEGTEQDAFLGHESSDGGSVIVMANPSNLDQLLSEMDTIDDDKSQSYLESDHGEDEDDPELDFYFDQL